MKGYIARSSVTGRYLQKGGYFALYPDIFEIQPEARIDLDIIECEIIFKEPLKWKPVKLINLIDQEMGIDEAVEAVLQLEFEGVIRRVGKGWEKLQ